MAFLISPLWRELLWVVSPSKHGVLKIHSVDNWNILYPLPMALGLMTLRYLLHRFCFIPFGVYLGIDGTKPKIAPTNSILENIYPELKKMSATKIAGVAKRTDMTEREIQRWLRQKKKQNRPTSLLKFCESCWKCAYYVSMFTYGLAVLWSKPWFWDIKESWTGYPNAVITSDIWWYYMVSMSFYWSLFFGQIFVDVRRKDFWEMLIHHVVTITLMSFSWLAGAFKIGTLVLVIHDFSDILLESAKMAKYAKYNSTCNVIFAFFTLSWLVTRLCIFPLWIIRHTLYDLPTNFDAYYTFNILLTSLFVLHCFWMYLILKIVVNSLIVGEVERDVRSSSEESAEN